MLGVDCRSRFRTVQRIAILSIFTPAAWAVWGQVVSPVHAQQASICWSTAALRSKPGDAEIAKYVPHARVEPPRDQRQFVGAARRWDHRPIRRVDLPASGRKLIALTFDFCEQPNEVAGYQGEIVDFLRDNSVKATFFTGGKWLLTHQERAQQLMADALFEIGNHTWGHRNFRVISQEVMRDEIWQTQHAYARLRASLEARACLTPGGGLAHQQAPVNMMLFRFPFGACNPHALHEVQLTGLRSIQWDVSAGDAWKQQTSDRIVQVVTKSVSSGSIVLFHANGRGWHTANALPRIVKELKAKSYTFVTVSELLAEPGAQPVFADTCYDFRPGDTNRYDSFSLRLEEEYSKFLASRPRLESAVDSASAKRSKYTGGKTSPAMGSRPQPFGAQRAFPGPAPVRTAPHDLGTP
jgi:peptidoglycan-N-acetylglucosamine deacetylase